MKELLIKLNACDEAIEWAGDRTIEEIVKDCDRGDWLLWLAKKIDIELQPLTLAKGHCANTVRHLMKNETSIEAVDMAIAFGEGRATMEELNNAASYAAAAAAYAAAGLIYAATYAAAEAAAFAASYAANAAADAATAMLPLMLLGMLLFMLLLTLLRLLKNKTKKKPQKYVASTLGS
jgi:hypothetical protein